jgi:hypothetical protein
MNAPYVDQPTSIAAAQQIDDHLERLERLVFDAIVAAGSQGHTCDELERETGLTHQTCSARVNRLMNAAWIMDSGLQRKTRSGRNAIVWVVAPRQTTFL